MYPRRAPPAPCVGAFSSYLIWPHTFCHRILEVWTERNCPSCLPLLLTRSILHDRVSLSTLQPTFPTHYPFSSQPLSLLACPPMSLYKVAPQSGVHTAWCTAGAMLVHYHRRPHCRSTAPHPHPPLTHPPHPDTTPGGVAHTTALPPLRPRPPHLKVPSPQSRLGPAAACRILPRAPHCTTRNYAEAIEQPPTRHRPAGYHPPWPARHRRRRRHRRRGDRRPAGCHRP